MKKIITVASGVLLLTLALVWWLDSREPKPVELIPTMTGQPEYCITCHADVPDISPSHPTEIFGCVTCHGGERLALDAELAHSTLRGGANPSSLSVVEASCGGSNCHSGSEADYHDHIQRVNTSIQATYAGAIANIRFTFGAQTDLTPFYGINAVADETTHTGITSLAALDLSNDTNPSMQQFGETCLTCHLEASPRDGEDYDRQTGCAACHAPLFDSPPIFSKNGGSQRGVHTLTTAIPYTQ